MSNLTIATLEHRPSGEVAEFWAKRGRRDRAVVVGQSEWVSFPDLGIMAIDAKVDTGARTSVLHAEEIELVDGDDGVIVRFLCHPLMDDLAFEVRCEAPLWDQREVRSSNGEVEKRPFIMQRVCHGDLSWEIELSLTSRRAMRHRMLLGRGALRRRFLVEPSRRHLLGRLDPEELYPGYHSPSES